MSHAREFDVPQPPAPGAGPQLAADPLADANMGWIMWTLSYVLWALSWPLALAKYLLSWLHPTRFNQLLEWLALKGWTRWLVIVVAGLCLLFLVPRFCRRVRIRIPFT